MGVPIRYWSITTHTDELVSNTDTITVGLLETHGAIGLNANNGRLTNVGTATASTDAVNKGYVDNLLSGLKFKEPARVATAVPLPAHTASGTGVGKTLTASANGTLTIDGVLVALNDRVLVKNDSSNNGIYLVTNAGSAGTAWVLTRATDADTSTEIFQAALFISEGTTYADNAFVCTNDNPITIDTTAISFVQFFNGLTYSFGAGLLESGGVVSTEVDTAANAQGAGTGGGSSGLEFDVAGASGKIRAAVNATSGLERTASGLGVRLNGSTLSSAAAGLSVLGLPSLFQVNGVATSANVTAANLTTLTGGGDASALHTHAGSPQVVITFTAGVGGSTAGSPCRFSANDTVVVADTLTASNGEAARVAGIMLNTTTVGNPVQVLVTGVAAVGAVTGGAAGAKAYLKDGGGVTCDPSSEVASNRILHVLGTMSNTTSLLFMPALFSKKA